MDHVVLGDEQDLVERVEPRSRELAVVGKAPEAPTEMPVRGVKKLQHDLRPLNPPSLDREPHVKEVLHARGSVPPLADMLAETLELVVFTPLEPTDRVGDLVELPLDDHDLSFGHGPRLGARCAVPTTDCLIETPRVLFAPAPEDDNPVLEEALGLLPRALEACVLGAVDRAL